MLYIDVQPPSECFWSGAGDGFVAVSATSTLLTAVRSTSTSSVTFPIRPQLLVFYSNNPKNESLIELRSKVRQMDRPTDWRIAARQHCLMPSSYCIGRRHNNTTSIWKMLGPFATASRFTLPFTRCRYCRTPPAHRCPRQRRQQRQRVTELWPHGMGPISNQNTLCSNYWRLGSFPHYSNSAVV